MTRRKINITFLLTFISFFWTKWRGEETRDASIRDGAGDRCDEDRPARNLHRQPEEGLPAELKVEPGCRRRKSGTGGRSLRPSDEFK